MIRGAFRRLSESPAAWIGEQTRTRRVTERPGTCKLVQVSQGCAKDVFLDVGLERYLRILNFSFGRLAFASIATSQGRASESGKIKELILCLKLLVVAKICNSIAGRTASIVPRGVRTSSRSP